MSFDVGFLSMRHNSRERCDQSIRSQLQDLPVESDVDFDGKIAIPSRNFFQLGVQPVANSQNFKNLSTMFTLQTALFVGR